MVCNVHIPEDVLKCSQLAKMIRYLGISQFACDFTFGIFLVSWLITRHVLFLLVIKAVYDTPKFLGYMWEPETGRYLSTQMYFCFNILLMSLQVGVVQSLLRDKLIFCRSFSWFGSG